ASLIEEAVNTEIEVRCLLAVDDHQSYEIAKVLVWDTFNIYEQFLATSDQLGSGLEEGLPCPQGVSLQLHLESFPPCSFRLPPPWPDQIRQLGDSEDAFLFVAPHELRCHPVEERQRLPLSGPAHAALAELATPTVIVEHESGWRWGVTHLPQLSERLLTLAQPSTQPNSCGRAFLAMPKDAICRRFTLDLRKEQAEDFQDDSLFLADLPSLVEQHRNIVEVPEPRRPIHLLQPIEAYR